LCRSNEESARTFDGWLALIATDELTEVDTDAAKIAGDPANTARVDVGVL